MHPSRLSTRSALSQSFVILFFGIVLLPASTTWADIRLAKIFSDNMVLQRNSMIVIWGSASPSQKLKITFLNQTVHSQANERGDWSAQLKTGVHGGPYQLEVATEGDGPKVVLSNVMVGEVWLCSGQSNMEWPLTAIQDSKQEIEAAKNWPNLRLFTVVNETSPIPLDEFSNVQSWQVCSSENAKSFSAVAYFFGRELSRNMDGMPIGLIDSTWGGTPAEAWVSKTGLESKPELQPMLKFWNEKEGGANQSRPAFLFNAMISPLARMRIRGAIWYQGESNNGRGKQYRTLLPTLIEDWRATLHDPEMPFYFVQLAPFRYGGRTPNALPEIWDAQLFTLKSVPHTGMIVTTDIGDFTDIHPRNKQDVGGRLAGVAFHHLYQSEFPETKKLALKSPIYHSQSIEGGKITVRFEYTADGLMAKGDQQLTEFMIADASHNWVPAKAKIVAPDQVVVWADDVTQPLAVRFCWNDTPAPNLFNSAGLPASPFRTDDFQLESANTEF